MFTCSVESSHVLISERIPMIDYANLDCLGIHVCLHDEGKGGQVDTGAHSVAGVGLADMTSILYPRTDIPVHTGDLPCWI